MTFDIKEHPNILENINAILSNSGICELKIEHNNKDGCNYVTCVEKTRKLKSSEKII